ncbi:DNA topoisomerase 3-alpha [Prorops nasuta]|uniref:DNA topoisomerase 3-alpha n=1 Tax=Prorops nasuta TaxID=863751 RepID=UPI0034CDB99E
MRLLLCQMWIHSIYKSLLLYDTKYVINVTNRQFTSKKIMKVLNVAEKNDAAKNIANIISRGGSRKREGLSKYNKIYEFNTQLWNKNCEMIMTSVSGHLLGYDFQGIYRKWQSCNPLSLFDAPVFKSCTNENLINIKKTLEKEVRGCEALIIWTDCDREGENIGFEIIQVCQAIKPRIRIHRAKFSEITHAAINQALHNLTEPNKPISDAVDVRSELDLRIGAAFTRFQTLRLQKVFPRTLKDCLISYGSCQFPTLGFVVERYLAIQRFQPEPYWKLKVKDDHDNIFVEFRWSRGRLFEELPCQVFLDICLESPNATVQKVTKKPKSKWRPLPLDTIELEKQGSRKLHMTAKETMKIAEKLYTQGFISYPRTETNIFPSNFNLSSLVSQQTENPTWGNFAARLLEEGLTPRAGKKSDQAHPPIHPTKYTNSLTGLDAKVYEFIVRHFLACLSKNAEGFETIIEINISGEKFIANGLEIVAKNYLEVYIYEKWNDKEIHRYQEGQVFRPTDISMVQEETSAPNLLKEADLIALMDKHGIGTDATHAEHIDTIKARQYVGLTNNQHFLPGKLGIGLVMGYDEMGFPMSKPHLRSDLEKDLQLVCEAKKDPKVVLQTQIEKYREVFKVAMERAHLIDASLANYIEEQPTPIQETEVNLTYEDKTILSCPKCGSNMILRKKQQNTEKYVTCVAYPSCNNSIWFPSTVEDVEVLNENCNTCTDKKLKLKFKLKRNAFPLFGLIYESCIGGCDQTLNEAFNIKNESIKKSVRTNDSGYNSNIGVPNYSQTYSINSTSRRQQQENFSRPSNTISERNQQNAQANNNIQDRSAHSGMSVSSRTSENRSMAPSATYTAQDTNHVWGTIDAEAVIMCNCGETAIRLTVRKEGVNQGRQFFKCAKPQGSGCNFFLWESQNENSTASNTSLRNATNNTNSYQARPNNQINSSHNFSYINNVNTSTSTSTSTLTDIKCNCGESAKQLTVLKEGPNKGRKFYGCSKSREIGCNFFQWADSDATQTTQNWSGTSAGRGRNSRPQGNSNSIPPGATRAKRKCGICGIEGHTRKTCTVNLMD